MLKKCSKTAQKLLKKYSKNAQKLLKNYSKSNQKMRGKDPTQRVRTLSARRPHRRLLCRLQRRGLLGISLCVPRGWIKGKHELKHLTHRFLEKPRLVSLWTTPGFSRKRWVRCPREGRFAFYKASLPRPLDGILCAGAHWLRPSRIPSGGVGRFFWLKNIIWFEKLSRKKKFSIFFWWKNIFLQKKHSRKNNQN